MSLVSYAVVTAVVYNVLLRGIPDEGFVVSPWPGEIMHVWIPIVLLLDWLVSPGRPSLRWTGLRIVIIFPLVWLAFTLVRGALTAWYPYPFLQPDTGWVSVLGYIAGISAFILALASLAIAYSRLRVWTRA
ncbi:MAG: Pr6Pr family membrane protein [Rhodoglobus sp.]|nr:Pr6Pr family membrane protein [Rhodoglobus sp.]